MNWKYTFPNYKNTYEKFNYVLTGLMNMLASPNIVMWNLFCVRSNYALVFALFLETAITLILVYVPGIQASLHFNPVQ